jgi:NADPH:quinone reductase-like Zn-dependent oxidoreductase
VIAPNAIRSYGAHPAGILLRQLASPLLILLGAATLIAFFFGERTDALIITVIIGLSVGLGFFNKYRSERALAELHARIRHQAVTVRDGRLKSVEVTQLVPGDVVLLEVFVGRVAALTGGVGVDAVFDPMGSAHLKRSVKTVRKGGSVVGYGFYETANRGGNVVLDVLSQYLRLALWSLPPQRKHVAFYDIRSQKKKRPDWFREDLTALFGLLAAGTLRPVIAERLPLEDVVKAHQQVEHAEVQGKLVLIPNP